MLTDLLAAEHAAVYAYGLVGARLDEETRHDALAAFDAHRGRRDDLLALLRKRGLPTPGPEPVYAVTVTGRSQALDLALQVETGLGVRWRDLVGATEDAGLRRLGVQGLTDTAVRAAQWRVRAGSRPATVALPGEV